MEINSGEPKKKRKLTVTTKVKLSQADSYEKWLHEAMTVGLHKA